MLPVSVVIITRNEMANIEDCIISARLISHDIVVVDAQSNDNTGLIATNAGARVITVPWETYGKSRNTGAAACLNNWVLALDADERITHEFAYLTAGIKENSKKIIYGFSRKSFFAGKKIRFGTWGRDRVFRLYDRRYCCWDTTPVHEKLVAKGFAKKQLACSIIHFPVRKEADFTEKITRYALLTAQKYLLQKRNSNWVKRLLGPVYVFVQSYFFFLGFLDGKEGLIIARQLARYTRLKYLHLAFLQKGG